MNCSIDRAGDRHSRHHSTPPLSAEVEHVIRTLLAHAGDAMLIQDPAGGGIVDANDAASALYGYSREEFQRLPHGRCLWAADDGGYEDTWARPDLNPPSIDRAVRWLRRRSGEIFPADVTVSRLELAGRSFLIGTVRDRSGQTAAQSLLEAKVAETEGLLALSSLLQTATGLESVLDRIVEGAIQLVGADFGGIGLPEGDSVGIDRLWTDGTWHAVNTRLPLGESTPAGAAFRTGAIVTVEDTSRDPRFDLSDLARREIHTFALTPVKQDGGAVVALLGVGSRRGGQVYGARHRRLLEAAASHAGAALERARIEQERARSQAALEASLAALTNSEERFRSLAQNVSDLITLVGVDGTIRYQSPAVEAALGYHPAELIGMSALSLVHPEDRAAAAALNAAVLSSTRPQPAHEFRLRHKDGSWRHLEIVATNLLEDASVRAIAVNSRDVTERRRTEESRHFLAEASARLSTSLDYDDMLDCVTRYAIPFLGDWCAAHIVGDDGHLDRSAVAAVRTDVAALQEELRRKYPFDLLGDHPVAAALRTSTARVVPEVTEAGLSRFARDEEHLRLLRTIGTTSWMTVPLIGRRARLGALSFGVTDSARRYGAEDVALAEELAWRLALALENAQLYHELAVRKSQLEDLVARLMTAHEAERRRTAYEVHDGVAQVAASAHQHLQAYSTRYRPRRAAARQELDRALALAQRTVHEARRVVAGLRPTALDDFGLATALRHEVGALSSDGWDMHFDHDLGVERLPAAVETALFRVAQEALANARKHSRSTRLTVRLHRSADAVRLEVCDDGVGFGADDAAPAAPGERVGIAGMQERVNLLGGRFRIESRPGKGTRIVATIPLARPA